MDNIDLKLLAVFDAIFKTGSVSQAARLLDVGQPAVSMGLRKLREHFSDPLFVRTSAGMAPTRLADGLRPYVSRTLALMHTVLDYRIQFDPVTSERSFRVAMSDIAQVIALPALLRIIKREAPLIRLDIIPVSENTARLLESGEVDLAIGFMAPMDTAFYQQKLLDERFVCIASAGHSRIGKTLSLAQFQQELHMAVSSTGASPSLIDQMLHERGIRRTVAVQVPNIAGISANIEDTDYLAMVPERLGQFLRKGWGIKLLALPFDMDGYQVMQHWHERHAREPGNRWLRSVVAGIFRDQPLY